MSRQLLTSTYSRPVTCFLAFLVLVVPKWAYGATLTVQELGDIARARCEAMEGIRLSYVTYQEGESTRPGPGTNRIIPRQEDMMLLHLKEGMFYWDSFRQMPQVDETVEVKTAFDGEMLTRHIVEQRQGSIERIEKGTVDPRWDGMRRCEVLSYMMVKPETEGGMGIDDGSLVSYLKHSTVRSETEEINGIECIVVDLTVKAIKLSTMWLDPHRSLLPIRKVGYGKDGKIISEGVVTKIGEFQDSKGGKWWLPVEFERRLSFPDRTIQIRTTVDPNETQVNPTIDKAMFRVEFPPGTAVYDAEYDLSFTIPDSENLLRLLSIDDAELAPIQERRREGAEMTSVSVPPLEGTKYQTISQEGDHDGSDSHENGVATGHLRYYLVTVAAAVTLTLVLVYVVFAKRGRS